ncbi:MAG: hypothetical protein LBV80_04845 [Deltaproteobacteria bacterium]|jgi:hypothetical protein|nr:hypothetical protein [Deltaproteobacteria bacterium]
MITISLTKKNMLLGACGLFILAVVGIGLFFLYLNFAFPVKHATGTHLAVPDQYTDCVTCHTKVSAQVTQDWREAKHGVTLVKCVVCHGEPDGKGSIPFMATPDPKLICSRCHDPAVVRMEAKYGNSADCYSCHAYHQNPVHSNAYETRVPTTQTTLDQPGQGF